MGAAGDGRFLGRGREGGFLGRGVSSYQLPPQIRARGTNRIQTFGSRVSDANKRSIMRHASLTPLNTSAYQMMQPEREREKEYFKIIFFNIVPT